MAGLVSCVNKTMRTWQESLRDGRYDSEFPSRNASPEIETITHSVRKLYNVSHYTTYQFTHEARVSKFNIRDGSFRKYAFGTISTQESGFGTATMLYSEGNKVALLTCAHVVLRPDTLISLYDPIPGDPATWVRSISILEKQENWIKDFYDCGSFVILAADMDKDIAILGKECEHLDKPVEVFSYPKGNAKELGWGSFVYLIGYPMGTPVVTKALVSKPNPASPQEFTVDALLNKGFSGGVILAIRDGVPNFELVGMIKSVSSTREYYLKPESDDQTYYQVFPYSGTVHVGSLEQVQYGLNYVIPMEEIRAFYSDHREGLVRDGYNLDSVLK